MVPARSRWERPRGSNKGEAARFHKGEVGEAAMFQQSRDGRGREVPTRARRERPRGSNKREAARFQQERGERGRKRLSWERPRDSNKGEKGEAAKFQ